MCTIIRKCYCGKRGPTNCDLGAACVIMEVQRPQQLDEGVLQGPHQERAPPATLPLGHLKVEVHMLAFSYFIPSLPLLYLRQYQAQVAKHPA